MRCRAHRITNAEKVVLAAPEVSFRGFRLNKDGAASDEEKKRAIVDFLKPANLTDLRSFFDLVNQLAEFIRQLAESAESLVSSHEHRPALLL